MAKMKSLVEVEEQLAKHLNNKDDLWKPRGKVFILSRIAALELALEEANKELTYERDVNRRVREVFGAWLGILK